MAKADKVQKIKKKKKRVLITGLTISFNILTLDEDGSVDSPPGATPPYFMPTKEWLKEEPTLRKLAPEVFEKIEEQGKIIYTTKPEK